MPKFYPPFLTALRADLRRGELIALKRGDIRFGVGEQNTNRYILVQRDYVRQIHRPKASDLGA